MCLQEGVISEVVSIRWCAGQVDALCLQVGIISGEVLVFASRCHLGMSDRACNSVSSRGQ
jgi:hypothetical protein